MTWDAPREALTVKVFDVLDRVIAGGECAARNLNPLKYLKLRHSRPVSAGYPNFISKMNQAFSPLSVIFGAHLPFDGVRSLAPFGGSNSGSKRMERRLADEASQGGGLLKDDKVGTTLVSGK